MNFHPFTLHTNLANYLIRDGLLNLSLESLKTQFQQQSHPLTTFLIETRLLSSDTLLTYCAQTFCLATFDLKQWQPEWLEQSKLSRPFILRYRFVPLMPQSQHLCIAIADPTLTEMIDAIRFHIGIPIQPVLVDELQLQHLLATFLTPADTSSPLMHHLQKLQSIPPDLIQPDETTPLEEPIIEFVDQLIQEALSQRVSDIHIEPFANECRIRFRQDGLLAVAACMPPHLAIRIMARIKIMAHLNIAEKRLPQDGRISFPQQQIDIRVNSCPTLYGEKIVLRLLDIKHFHYDIHQLGMTEQQQSLFIEKLRAPQGLILVTGPTGSGKTITLYAALQYLNHIEKNIMSVEDPVEIELAGITQVAINPRIDLTFSTLLRTFLRQDPDIMMVGEIRDSETATVALQAAQTGHLVLSTLHTNSALESLMRLRLMGVATHYLTSLSCIIAQRLIRRLCEHCKILTPLQNDHDHFYQANGCDFCFQGYRGRIALFEIIPMTARFIDLMLTKASPKTFAEEIQKEQILLLWEAGLLKVKAGLTTLSELKRVLPCS